MTGDSCNLVVCKDHHQTRFALSDMTNNLPSKRGISSILGDLLLKSGGDDNKSIVAPREGGGGGGSGVKFSKRLCLVVDDLVKESTRTTDSSGSGSDDKNNSSGDADDESDLVDVKESQGETNLGEGGEICVQEMKCEEKDSDMNVFSSQTDDVVGGDLDNKLAIVEIKNEEGTDSLLDHNNNSQKSSIKSFSMNRCSNQDMEADDDDELKSCSCSFCLKAAYIWSDLHYQDIKGRLSVLKKSQKEASNLIQRNGKGGKTMDNTTNGDFDMMGQWTSLFLSMQSILSNESNHLQNSFVTMKELRENCKIDLEKSVKTPQQQNNNNNNT